METNVYKIVSQILLIMVIMPTTKRETKIQSEHPLILYQRIMQPKLLNYYSNGKVYLPTFVLLLYYFN